jgi:hypothetical protein
MHLLARFSRAHDALFGLLENGALMIALRIDEHISALRKLLQKYRDRPMSRIVRMAETAIRRTDARFRFLSLSQTWPHSARTHSPCRGINDRDYHCAGFGYQRAGGLPISPPKCRLDRDLNGGGRKWMSSAHYPMPDGHLHSGLYSCLRSRRRALRYARLFTRRRRVRDGQRREQCCDGSVGIATFPDFSPTGKLEI